MQTMNPLNEKVDYINLKNINYVLKNVITSNTCSIVRLTYLYRIGQNRLIIKYTCHHF